MVAIVHWNPLGAVIAAIHVFLVWLIWKMWTLR